jgi:O-antigen ligase
MDRAQDFRFTGTALCWGLFLLVVAASTGFLSMYPQVSYIKLGFTGLFIGALLLMARGPGEYPAVIYGVVCGIIIASLIAFVAFPFVGYMFTFGGDSLAGRFSGVLAHPQLLSCLIAVSLPLLIYTYVVSQGLQRGWALIILGLAFALMYITSSRGGMLAGLVSTMAILGLLIWRPSSPTARHRAWGLALILVAGGLIAAISAADSVRDFVFKNERAVGVNLSGRDKIIEQSWAAFRARPLLGNGFQVPSEFTEHGASTFGTDDNVSIEKCFFLTMILEETGAVGGFLFLLGLWLLLYQAYKSRSFVFVSCLLGFLTVNLAEAVIFSPSSLGGLCWLVCFSTHRLRA